jgi:hypothetical protein
MKGFLATLAQLNRQLPECLEELTKATTTWGTQARGR